MPLVQTEQKDFVRDTNTRALLPVDRGALQRHRATRNMTLQTKRHQDTTDMRFTAMAARIDRCEDLLIQLVKQVEILVTR